VCAAAGEQGIVPEGNEGAGKPYHLKGKPFYRIIDGFIDQSGEQLSSTVGVQVSIQAARPSQRRRMLCLGLKPPGQHPDL
jgi:hypothetical protein